MSDFATTWELTRKRFDDAVLDLDQDQLNWKLHPEALTLGEAALHVAGVEVSFISQLLDSELDAHASRLRSAATDGVVNDSPFPFTPGEITPDLVRRSLDQARAMVAPVIASPSQQVLERQIKSALGPIIDGSGAFARLAYHPGYHQGQAHLVRSAPGFPR